MNFFKVKIKIIIEETETNMSGTGIFMFHVGAAEVTVYFWEHTKEDY
jgi:hypothetical protein